MRPLYCIIGPSGSGKSKLVENIKKEFDWMESVDSYTTRQPRYLNESGHIFITKEEFDKLNLIAYTVFNNYEYGVTAELLDKADLYIIDLDGYLYLKEHYKNRKIIVIGLDVDPAIRFDRMLNRGDTVEQAKARLEHDGFKFLRYLDYCDVVLNANESEEAVLAQFIDKTANF